jgi:hypothetical protein
MDPPLCIQRCSSSLTPMQILRMLRHGGNLTLWRDIGRFFLSWGYIQISLNNTYRGIVKNRQQHGHLRDSDEFITSSSLVPMLATRSLSQNTPKPRESARATSTRCTVCYFYQKIVPCANISIPASRPGQRLVGHRSCLLQRTSLTNKSLKQRGRAEVTCCSTMVSKWNDCWLLRVMNEYILCARW